MLKEEVKNCQNYRIYFRDIRGNDWFTKHLKDNALWKYNDVPTSDPNIVAFFVKTLK